MKTIIKILWCLVCFMTLWCLSSIDTYAVTNVSEDEVIITEWKQNEMLNSIFRPGDDKVVWERGAEWIQATILKIAQDFKNLVTILATIALLVLVFRLFFASNTDEEVAKFKAGILYTVLGIALMQISYSVVSALFDQDIDKDLWEVLIQDVFEPIINLLLFGAAFAFLVMGIIAFYMLITANGDEEKSKKWKQTVLYAVAWFIVIKFAETLVKWSYSWTYNPTGAQTTDLIDLISRIINWVNTFVGLVTVLMIMYAWAQLMFWFWDEEKLKKAKMSLVYIAIGLLILVANFGIVTFFLRPEAVI